MESKKINCSWFVRSKQLIPHNSADMDFNMKLLQRAKADIDVRLVGFILISAEPPERPTKNYKVTQQQTSSPSNTTQCSICNKMYVSRSNLRRHLNEVHLNRLNECKICKIKLGSKRKLSYHLKRHGQLLECDFCGRQCIPRHLMHRHMMDHKTAIINKCLY